MLRTAPLICFLAFLFLQGASQDTLLPNKMIGYEQLTSLKNGALIVRLKTNDKSVAAYRNSGRTDIANKIIADRKVQNEKIMDAFRSQFDFCKVYFIYATDADEILCGNKGYFLNEKLERDTSLQLKEDYFLFAEYGSVAANMLQDEYHYKNVNKTVATSTLTTSSAIFISDTTLTQLKEPFPFYQTVMLDNYQKAVERLNAALYRVYYRWTMKKGKAASKEKK